MSLLSNVFTKVASCVLLALFSASYIHACTGIKLVASDGSLVHGRTLEFGMPVETSVAVVPRGYSFTGTTPQGPGLQYRSKYATVGVIAFNNPAIVDGINEMGLAVGVFYFPGFAGYANITPSNQKIAVSPVEFSNWIVTQFATVDEVKNALSTVVIAPTVSQGWGPTAPPFHYIVYDKSGKALVIEPMNGKFTTYDNPIGVMTNSPTFDWHMTNLRNFINMSPFNANPTNLSGVTLAPFGQGSGMVGVPGDFSPPSRFVRAAIYSGTAMPSKNSSDAVMQAFHILNQFDIPLGTVRQKEQSGKPDMDYTLCTCVRDPQALNYYFKTYDDQTIKVVNLNAFDPNAKTIKTCSTAGSNPPAVDISSNLK